MSAILVATLRLMSWMRHDFTAASSGIGELPGFGLRLRAGGHRAWICQYRNAAGRTRRVTIGNVAKLSATQARDAARKLLAQVELGGDPQSEREEQRRKAAGTFQAAVGSYLAAKEGELRAVSYRVTKLYLTGPYFKALQAMALGEIRRSDVAACVRAIVRKHSGPTAAAARRALSAFFAWTIAEGLSGRCEPSTGLAPFPSRSVRPSGSLASAAVLASSFISIDPRLDHCRCLNDGQYQQYDVQPEHAARISVAALAKRIDGICESMHRFNDRALSPQARLSF
jgi:hypothetical protein